MKQQHFLSIMLLIAVTLCACNQQINELSITNPENRKSEAKESFYRDYESALQIAKSQVFGNTTRSTKEISVKSHYIYTPICTRNTTNQEKPSFHVINFENDKGFAVISTDERTTPVYAYSDKGNLYLNEAVQESGWGTYMNLAAEKYAEDVNTFSTVKQNDSIKPIIPTLPRIDKNYYDELLNKYGDVVLLSIVEIGGVRCRLRSTTDETLVGTPISTLWDQCSPYNYYYPTSPQVGITMDGSAPAGCGPIAVGQIMAYHKYPTTYNEKVIDWEAILSKHYYSLFEYTYASKSTASLIYEIALAGNAKIDATSTQMSHRQIGQVLSKFNYTYHEGAYTIDKVWNSLENNRPVYIGGEKADGKGHAWVVDAGKTIVYGNIYYYDEPPYNIYMTTTNSIKKYLHCNWGNGEKYPATYCLDVFTDPGNNTYNKHLYIIYNIQPK